MTSWLTRTPLEESDLFGHERGDFTSVMSESLRSRRDRLPAIVKQQDAPRLVFSEGIVGFGGIRTSPTSSSICSTPTSAR